MFLASKSLGQYSYGVGQVSLCLVIVGSGIRVGNLVLLHMLCCF